jgi:hypothetical protein
MKLSVGIIVTCVFCGAALGQSGVLPPALGTPEQTLSLLTSTSIEQRQKIARLLHLNTPWEQESVCVEYGKVELSKPVFKAGSASALLTIPARDCDFTFLVPFMATGNGWTPAGTIALWTHYSLPKYRIESLTTQGESEIVVSGQTVDAGTGILQRNLTIIKIVDNSLRVVFDEPEWLNMSIPATIEGKLTNTSDEETSTFTFVNSEPGVPGLKTILETRVLRVRGRTITIYRSYVWRPALSIFRMLGAGPPNPQ